MNNDQYYLSDLGIVNCMGSGCTQVFDGLLASDRRGLCKETTDDGFFYIARVPSIKNAPNRIKALLEDSCSQIRASVEKLRSLYGANRIAVIIGSTDNGSEQSREALEYRLKNSSFPPDYDLLQQRAHYPAILVSSYFKLSCFSWSISTACTSSASAFGLAQRMLRLGTCDAVIVGGVDIVSESVLKGFLALEAIDRNPCMPFSKNRQGTNLGEAAALFVVAREDFSGQAIAITGIGESADAYHMTAPAPDGHGAIQAMRSALSQAKKQTEDIDYINLHGTGTQLNDNMEAIGTAAVFGNDVACSSSKSLTGHTLGAAGATELAFCWLLLSQLNPNMLLPIHLWDGQANENQPYLPFTKAGLSLPRLRSCMSNSFAFGGSNVSLIVERINP